jgi:uncharacterized protein YbaP (TraB family)
MLTRLLRPVSVAVAALAAVFPTPASWLPQQAVATQEPTQKQKLEKPEHGFIWKLEKEGLKTSYLFGTMHVPDKRFLKFNDTVQSAFKNADAVYTELNMDMLTSPETAKLIQELGMYKEGEGTLQDALPLESYEQLTQIMTEHFGFPVATVNGMRPFMASMTLEQFAVMREYGVGDALDTKIWNAAKKAGKEIGGVETLDEQLAAMSVLTEEEATTALIKSLDRMAKDIAEERVRISELAELYLKGDEAAMLAYVLEDFDPKDPIEVKFMKALLDDRNVRMAERSGKLMKANPDKSYVFAFGTLHMLGKNNVAELLTDQGYKVTRLTAPLVKEKASVKAIPIGR